MRAAGAPEVALRETCRVVAGRIPLWAYHRARLESGGCSGGLLDQVENAALAAAADWETTGSPRVRLSITVGQDGGVDVDVRRRLSSLDVPVGLVPARVDVEEAFSLPRGGAKPADRGWWDDAQKEARFASGHQAVIVGPDENVIDGGTATVWIAEGPLLITPPSPPAIAGVARAFILRQAPRNGMRVDIERISWARFEAADEAFFTNAFGGPVAVRDRDRCVFGAVREMFAEVWKAP